MAGIKFVYPSSQQLDVYRKGKVYSLQEAFDAGFLSYENLRDIHAKYGGARV